MVRTSPTELCLLNSRAPLDGPCSPRKAQRRSALQTLRRSAASLQRLNIHRAASQGAAGVSSGYAFDVRKSRPLQRREEGAQL
jgi:hypothetical protein